MREIYRFVVRNKPILLRPMSFENEAMRHVKPGDDRLDGLLYLSPVIGDFVTTILVSIKKKKICLPSVSLVLVVLISCPY
jgi:hypothetical protein